jgi:hypothetical protein
LKAIWTKVVKMRDGASDAIKTERLVKPVNAKC